MLPPRDAPLSPALDRTDGVEVLGALIEDRLEEDGALKVDRLLEDGALYDRLGALGALGAL